jgi:LDH2 family malate/lactate/ureidoglycolate dehydrogenase
MSEKEALVNAKSLESFVTALFCHVGMEQRDAVFSANAMVRTNLWGIDSHGVLRLPIYIRRLRSGAVKAKPDIKKIRGSQTLEVLHGDDGLGFIVGREAMDRAIQLAEKFNVGIVGAIRSNHFGAAALYARMAAERNMVGLAMTNVIPNMVMPGCSKPVVGNNPIAIAAPTFQEFPFVLDVSLSTVAGGKLLMASKKKEKIPLNWATDREGRPTDDPDKGFAGFLLPMGGHKGFGLALAVDILCGVLSGGVFLNEMKGMYHYPDDPSLTGHLMIAINSPSLMDQEEMKIRMESFCKTVKSAPMWDPSQKMLLPGEIEHRTFQERSKNGIPMPSKLIEELADLGKELGVPESLI